MRRHVYAIHGFDCASCADNAEAHLGKHPKVTSARIDFISSRLYMEYKDEELTHEEILCCIKEVESDPITLAEVDEEKEVSIDKKRLILWIRIAYCVAIFLLCGFLFKDLYWLRWGLYLSALVVIEYDIVAKVFLNIIHKRNPLDEYLLMSLASTGAFVLASVKFASTGQARAFGNEVFQMEEHFEAVLVCLLYQVGEVFQDIAVKHSAQAIRKAVDSRVEEALLITASGTRRVEAKQLRQGDHVVVASGMSIPVDGVIEEGYGSLDTSSLTGESLPVSVSSGDEVYSGTMLQEGQIRVCASKDYASSASSKILELVADSLEKNGNAEKFITTFARFYTPIVFALAALYIVFAGLFGPSWNAAVFTGLEIMVISCPCAIVISVPLAYFAAVGLASKNGLVFKGASVVDSLVKVRRVYLDKTGTLTKGRFAVKELVVSKGTKEEELKSALASLERLSSHPLAKSIATEYAAFESPVRDYASLPGKGVSGVMENETVFCGSSSLMKEQGIDCPEIAGAVIHASKGSRYLGYVRLQDEAKQESVSFVREAKKRGLSLRLLSGDKQENVADFAQSVGIDRYQGGLLPEDKRRVLEEEKEKGKCAFLGDGINDAPCLAYADVGVAMGKMGADLAVKEADVVLLSDDPRGLLKGMNVARSARRVIAFNIAFALASKLAVLILALIFKETMPMEVAVLADTGVCLLLVLNSLLLLSRKP